jgi:hypothetical protein
MTNTLTFSTYCLVLFAIVGLARSTSEPTGILFGPDVAFVSPTWNNVFPASDFNRNVSVPLWSTSVLSGESTALASELEGPRESLLYRL